MQEAGAHDFQGRSLLQGKVAVIYGAGGGVGGAVARAFAREGARVFLAGRTGPPLEAVARAITSSGGVATSSKVDALNPSEVEEHLQGIVRQEGRLDVSFNLIAVNVEMGASLTDLTMEQFDRAAFDRARSYFVTMTAAARIMERQGSGVILGLTAPSARLPRADLGGFAVAGAAIEALCRQLALEAGPRGVRVVCLRTGATPDNPVLGEVFAILAKRSGTTTEAIEKSEAQVTASKRLPLLAEVANASVLLASDYASAITATTANASCGELVD
jgi:3-oxoacyl-[acyl-carrier protein] reductase